MYIFILVFAVLKNVFLFVRNKTQRKTFFFDKKNNSIDSQQM